MSAGTRDRRIVLQTATSSLDPVTNQDVQSWDDQIAVMAAWLSSGSTEVWRARQIEASIEGIYSIPDLTPRPTPEGTRILGHDGRLYDLKSVTEIGRGRGLLLAVAARGEAV